VISFSKNRARKARASAAAWSRKARAIRRAP
jgi:hypothetical protein